MVVPHMGLFVPLATVRAWLEERGLIELASTRTAVLPAKDDRNAAKRPASHRSLTED